ncbi:MAG TPA: hypothetical protein PK196_04630 [Methanoculleus sp.]|nr:hypothetical protein [Methanoculleus sp.]
MGSNPTPRILFLAAGRHEPPLHSSVQRFQTVMGVALLIEPIDLLL